MIIILTQQNIFPKNQETILSHTFRKTWPLFCFPNPDTIPFRIINSLYFPALNSRAHMLLLISPTSSSAYNIMMAGSIHHPRDTLIAHKLCLSQATVFQTLAAVKSCTQLAKDSLSLFCFSFSAHISVLWKNTYTYRQEEENSTTLFHPSLLLSNVCNKVLFYALSQPLFYAVCSSCERPHAKVTLGAIFLFCLPAFWHASHVGKT